MSTEAVSGQGTRIYIGDGTPAPNQNFLAVSEAKTLGDWISPQPITEDASHFETPETDQDFIVIGRQLKPMTFAMNLIPDNPTHDEVTGLIYKLLQRVPWDFRVKLPGSSNKWAKVRALITDIAADELNRRSIMGAKVTIQPISWDLVESVGVPQ